MKKLYKRLCIISIVIIILTIWVIGRYNHIVNDNNIIGIEGEEVYFKTPPLGIRIKKGKPDKKGINTEAGNKYYLYENQNIFGCKGDIRYFYDNDGVDAVNVRLYPDYVERRDKLEYVCEYMKGIYSQREYFYDDGVREDYLGREIYRFGVSGDQSRIGVEIYGSDTIHGYYCINIECYYSN
ncbi:MAG: hypothetical protein IJZ96_04700 [Lachnospiraceae bacterium]|nr:hypothetical protein [Lachnospiraceae bacterium]